MRKSNIFVLPTGFSVNSIRNVFARAASEVSDPYRAEIAACTCIISMLSSSTYKARLAVFPVAERGIICSLTQEFQPLEKAYVHRQSTGFGIVASVSSKIRRDRVYND